MDGQNYSGFDWAFLFTWIISTSIGWMVGGFLIGVASFIASGVVMGALQYFALQRRMRQPRNWLIATTLGWAVAALVLLLLNPGQSQFLSGVILGVIAGFAQWLVLRQEVFLAGWWIMVNIVAWTSGLAFLPGFFSTGAVAGAVTGLALELLLRFPKAAAH
jgi:hypothetical protein